mmetsp:Transcript_53659/g.154709  ORF Transcript_53659/g.154709 Transcript_53659/m.154709 type:complete len:247 (-) Transcript_53659:15-755(-)
MDQADTAVDGVCAPVCCDPACIAGAREHEGEIGEVDREVGELGGHHVDLELVRLGAGLLEPEDMMPDVCGAEGTMVPEDEIVAAPELLRPEVGEALEVAGQLVESTLAEAEVPGASSGSGEPPPQASGASSSSSAPAPPALPANMEGADFGLAGAPDGWSRTSLGYVFNASHEMAGRITSWKGNTSCKCKRHGAKCSIARRSHAVTDGQMMLWLSLGEELAPAAGRQAKDLADAHKRLWREVPGAT